MALLLSTDNGYIVKRRSLNHYEVVYDIKSGGGGSDTWEDDDLYGLIWGQGGSPSGDIWVYDSHVHTSGNRSPVTSSDDGETWTNQTADSFRRYDGQIVPSSDASGDIYSFSNFFPVDSSWHVYKSSDNWHTITDIFNTGFTTIRSLRPTNGYIWYRLAEANNLHRLNLDGTGHTSTNLGLANTNHYMAVFDTSICLYVFGAGSAGTTIYIIDVTGGTPTVTTSVVDPFSGEDIVNISFVTNSTLVALTHTHAHNNTDPPGPSDDGSLWQSTDTGATWTRVAGPTNHLRVVNQVSPNNGQSSLSGGNNVGTVLNDEIWVATAVPYIYRSSDQGATWQEETCDADVSGGDSAFHNWDSMFITTPTPVYPGIARYPQGTTIQDLFSKTSP